MHVIMQVKLCFDFFGLPFPWFFNKIGHFDPFITKNVSLLINYIARDMSCE